MASFFVSLNLSSIAGLTKVASMKPTIEAFSKYGITLRKPRGCVRLSVIEPEKQAMDASGSSKKTVRAFSK